MFFQPRKDLVRILALVVIAFLLLFGWSQRHRFRPLVAGEMAPAYSAKNLDGAEVQLSDFAGKVVLLNVWATWCPPCVKEMPALERIYREFKADGLEVVAVSVDAPVGGFDSLGNPGGDIRAFAAAFDLTFTILHDPKRTVEPRFGLFGLPSTIVIGRDGRIVRKTTGIEAWDDEQHKSELRALLAHSS